MGICVVVISTGWGAQSECEWRRKPDAVRQKVSVLQGEHAKPCAAKKVASRITILFY